MPSLVGRGKHEFREFRRAVSCVIVIVKRKCCNNVGISKRRRVDEIIAFDSTLSSSFVAGEPTHK